ncbi:hypothetical protein N665_0321s0002 [Sinapis alba]|nr:hypothetical protein N665_0321s0002 [Sinapis alba]
MFEPAQSEHEDVSEGDNDEVEITEAQSLHTNKAVATSPISSSFPITSSHAMNGEDEETHSTVIHVSPPPSPVLVSPAETGKDLASTPKTPPPLANDGSKADERMTSPAPPVLVNSLGQHGRLQGAWAKPLIMTEDLATHLDNGIGTESDWPALSTKNGGQKKNQNVNIQSKSSRDANRNATPQTQRSRIPTDKARFPWAARMNPQSRNLHRVTIPEYMDDGTPKATRKWILQRSLWHVDDCIMFVAPWTASETLTIPEIISIPLWVKLKNIPTTLYSIFGIEWIASGLGEPMLSYKPWLDPTMLGEAKVMVEVELDKPFPQKVAAWDKQGNYSLVDVEYPWLPTPCEKCGQIGHKQKRCLSISGQKKTTAHIGNNDPADAETAPSVDLAATRKETTGSSDLAHDNLLDQVTSPDDQLKNRNEQIMIDNVSHAAADDLASLASPLLETAPLSNNDVLKVVPKGTSSVEVFGLGSNKFTSLVTFDGEEEQLDPDDSVDLLTPLGKRLLRERPVKPSAKAMEIQLQTTSRGRGSRGRGNRGRNR